MENELDIIVLRIVKTKQNKTLLQYATPDSQGAYYKGMIIVDQWNEGTKLFDTFDINNIGIPLKAHQRFDKSSRGMYKPILTDICTLAGDVLYCE